MDGCFTFGATMKKACKPCKKLHQNFFSPNSKISTFFGYIVSSNIFIIMGCFP